MCVRENSQLRYTMQTVTRQSKRAGEGAESRERMRGYGEGKRMRATEQKKRPNGEGGKGKERRSESGGEKRTRDLGRNRLREEHR